MLTKAATNRKLRMLTTSHSLWIPSIGFTTLKGMQRECSKKSISFIDTNSLVSIKIRIEQSQIRFYIRQDDIKLSIMEYYGIQYIYIPRHIPSQQSQNSKKNQGSKQARIKDNDLPVLYFDVS